MPLKREDTRGNFSHFSEERELAQGQVIFKNQVSPPFRCNLGDPGGGDCNGQALGLTGFPLERTNFSSRPGEKHTWCDLTLNVFSLLYIFN